MSAFGRRIVNGADKSVAMGAVWHTMACVARMILAQCWRCGGESGRYARVKAGLIASGPPRPQHAHPMHRVPSRDAA